MNVEFVPVGTLRPYGRNARTHSSKQIRKIASSIKRFGFNNPVLTDERFNIIAGHGRVAAAKQLGMAAVPVVRHAHLSEAEIRAYILADNKLALEAGWDREMLGIELQGLVDLDFEIELTGFETGEVDVILDEAAEAGGADFNQDDVVPEANDRFVVTRLGDVWKLGNHSLLCGDARETSSYDVLMEGAKAEFVFADPPYNVRIDGHVSGLGQT